MAQGETVEFWQGIALAVGSGLAQTALTVAVLKTDNTWLKQQVRDLAAWMVRVEQKADEALRKNS